MTEHNDLQHKLVNDVYAELGTISKHSQDVIDYLMRHGWIRTPDEAEAAARGEMPRRTMDKQELIKKISDEYTHLAPAVDTIINAAEHEGWLRNPDQAPGRTMKKSDYQELMDGTSLSYGVGFTDGFHMAGGSIVPDPEPTDVEKITRLILENSTDMDPKFIAEMLVENGVRPVKAGGDEPDAEHNRDWWVKNANVNDAEDCEACIDDLCPVHHGMAVGIEFVTKKIAALGGDPELFNSIPNPPKAPGGES